ncbi:proteic killer suppression protein [Dyadobacter soli]|uniref:Proteic killer suppression protein n=1 Tax=Dyadobacter soli TaxID=659014 RepID=A0A1G6ZS37_9BACT|nr:proteic killer suppression protein [Dyadobacter soli]
MIVSIRHKALLAFYRDGMGAKLPAAYLKKSIVCSTSWMR